MERRQIERMAGQQVPIECLQMPEIKEDAVALRNWTLIHRIGTNDLKQIVSKLPYLLEFAREELAGCHRLPQVYPIEALDAERHGLSDEQARFRSQFSYITDSVRYAS